MTHETQNQTTPTVSPDGQWTWNGTEWVATEAAPGAPGTSTPAATAPPKKRRLWLKIGGGIVALIIAASLFGGGESDPDAPAGQDTSTSAGAASDDDKAEDQQAEEEKAEDTPSTPGIGDEVADGKFTFTVTDVETGVARVGSDFLTEEAQGAFTLVTLRVENTGDEPQTFFTDNLKGTDSNGRTVSADSAASYVASGDSNAWMEEINPGNAITVTVVFDLAKGATLDVVRVHDSAFSGGAEISLH